MIPSFQKEIWPEFEKTRREKTSGFYGSITISELINLGPGGGNK